MKRDMDVARRILFAIEADEGIPIAAVNLDLDGVSPVQLSYHVQLLDEAGLIQATNFTSSTGYAWKAHRLTWAGHEFLDNVRDDTRWKTVKMHALNTSGSLSLGALQAAISQMIAGALG